MTSVNIESTLTSSDQRPRITPVRSTATEGMSVSSLKERGRVKRGFAGLLSVFRVVGGMLDWPAGLVWPAWGRGLPCFPVAADPG
jgi:hypothetical protein